MAFEEEFMIWLTLFYSSFLFQKEKKSEDRFFKVFMLLEEIIATKFSRKVKKVNKKKKNKSSGFFPNS